MKPKIYLASASPRRIELIQQLNRQVVICPQNINERSDKKRPNAIVCQLAKLKSADLPKKYYNDLVISADTIVWHNSKVLGKPKDKAQAKHFLKMLSGKWHSVYTGVCISYKGEQKIFYVRSQVKFRKLTTQTIDDYVATGSPMDKAGGYGIQDSNLVEKYKGSYDNIVGLPIKEVMEVVKQMEEQ